MTPEQDRLLQSAVHDLANEARPVSLVAASLQRARQIRARRRVAAMAAAACALILAVTIGFLAPGRSVGSGQLQPAASASADRGATPTADVPPSEHPPATLAPSGPFLIRPGLMVVATAGRQQPSYVYDRAHRRYVAIPASPDRTDISAPSTGNLVALADYDRARTLTDVSTGRSIDLDNRLTGSRGFAWSADGKQLAALDLHKIGNQQLVVTDAATGGTRLMALGGTGCNDYCFVSWLPGNAEVAVAVTDHSVPHDESKTDPQRGLQAYSVTTGKPTRFLPVRGAVYGPQAWSPDGRYVVVEGLAEAGGAGVPQVQVVEVATGKVRAVLPARVAETASFIGAEEILVPVGDAVELRTIDWRLNDRIPLPTQFTGAESVVVGPVLP